MSLTTAADIRTWHANIEQHASEGVNKILIGNKCDWTDDLPLKAYKMDKPDCKGGTSVRKDDGLDNECKPCILFSWAVKRSTESIQEG